MNYIDRITTIKLTHREFNFIKNVADAVFTKFPGDKLNYMIDKKYLNEFKQSLEKIAKECNIDPNK